MLFIYIGFFMHEYIPNAASFDGCIIISELQNIGYLQEIFLGALHHLYYPP